MDNFKEQLVKQEADGRIYLLRGCIIAAEMCLIALLVMITMMYPAVLSITFLLGFGSFFLLAYLLNNTSVEYEYIVTNNDFDVDKIIGKRKRKRLISISLPQVKEIGEYKTGLNSDAGATVLATDGTGMDVWYMTAEHKEYKTVMIVFSPNDELLDTLNPALPYSLRLKRDNKTEEETE